MKKILNSGIWFLILSIITIAIDWFTKTYIVEHIEANVIDAAREYHVISNIFMRIIHVHNTGAAFSFLAEHSGWQQWIFGILAIAICIYLGYTLTKNKASEIFKNSACALIIGGAIGNFYDRLTYGYVIDFLDFFWKSELAEKHYPAFNVADIAICVGVALFVIIEIFDKKKQ